MSNLLTHARHELDLIGMTEDGDEMNAMMRRHILTMMEVFANEGHSGFSAQYAANALSKLMKFEPLSPLTGADDEWTEIAKEQSAGNTGTLYQNKRASHVFKDDNGAYDINGKVFWEWFEDENHERHKSYYTCYESRVPVTFPYTPTTVYEERQTPEMMGS